MKLSDIFEMNLADALAKTSDYGSSLNKSAKKRNMQMTRINRKSSEFQTRARDLVAGWPNISLEDFKDEMMFYFPEGDPETHYFKWKDGYKEAGGIGNVA